MIRARLRRLLGWARSIGAGAIRVLRLWPEALQVLGILSGWALLTYGLASLLVWQVWPISLGLLVFSMVGWGYLKKLFGKGLYELSQEPPKRREIARG